jgi:predicted RNA binding protein YcfA (HicA-like mRNA interferase family)
LITKGVIFFSLKPLSYDEIYSKLRKIGFEVVKQKGSHVKFVKEDKKGKRVVIVPKHKEIAVGTLRSILRQAGLTPEDFKKI